MSKYILMHVVTLIFAILTVVSALVVGITKKESTICVILLLITLILNCITRVMEKKKIKIEENKIEELKKM